MGSPPRRSEGPPRPARRPSFRHSERSEESVSPVLLGNRDAPSVTFGDSSLGEGAKDGGYGFDRLTASEWRKGGVVLLCVGRDDSARQEVPYRTAGGQRPPLPQCFSVFVGAACGRPPTQLPLDGGLFGFAGLRGVKKGKRTLQIWGPHGRRNAFRGERTSKGAERVFAVRRKQSEADFARTKRSEESVSPVLLANRGAPSVTFGDSSLGEGAKGGGYGFDRLTASE